MSRNILMSVGTLTIISLIAKGIGFAKQATIAAYFGASIDADIYFLAAGIVANLLYAIDTALRTVVLPMYSKKLSDRGDAEASKLVSSLLILFAFVAVVIMLIVILIAPFIAKLIAFTYDASSLHTLSGYIRIISVTLFFSVIITIFAAVLNANRQYAFPRATSMLQSIIAILSVIIFYKHLGILSLVFALPVAYFLQTIVMFLFIKTKTLYKFSWQYPDSDSKIALRRMLPVFLGSATLQINQIVNKIISSSLETGSVSALSYSGTLIDFVTVIFISSVTTVFFTELSSTAAARDIKNHKLLIRRGVASLTLLLVPISVISVMFAKDIIVVVFQRGAFDEEASILTSLALMGYSVGFLFYGLRAFLDRSFYSFGDTKTPLINSVITVIVNIVLSIVLSRFLGVGGIAFGASIAAITSVTVLCYLLKRKLNGLGFRKLLPTMVKIISAAVIMVIGLSILKTMPYFGSLISLNRFIIATMVGGSLYILVLVLLRCEELLKLKELLVVKLRKRKKTI